MARSLSLFLLLLILSAASQRGATAAIVTVDTVDGRRWTGELDACTGKGALCLSWSRGSAHLRRSFAWEHVERLFINGDWYTAAELQHVVTQPSWLAHFDPFVDDPPREVLTSPRPALPAQGLDDEDADARREPVVSLTLEAYVGNWDSDVPVDGVAVHLFPLSEFGEVVPVDGSVTIEIVGTRPATRSEPSIVRILGQQTFVLDASALGPQGYVCKIPFQAGHPDFDMRWGTFGIVHARLTIPGAGVFEASADMVRVRPYSAVRDRLQQVRGRRFLPGELQGSVPVR